MNTDAVAALLDEVISIIEVADNRAMAADGPVGHVRYEMSDKEWRDLYVALTKARAALAAAPLPSDTPADGLAAREFRFTTWDGSSLVVTVDDEDPGDIGEPRMVEDYDDATSYISVAAVALTQEPRSGDVR